VQGTQVRSLKRWGQMSRIVRRRMSIFRRPQDLWCPERGQSYRSIDYIRCGKASEKVGCGIGLTWVGAGAAFDERGHGVVWGFQGGVDGHKISFSLGTWFSCNEQDRQEGLFFNERLAVVGGNTKTRQLGRLKFENKRKAAVFDTTDNYYGT